MKVLIIGSGGREHALAWAIARDDMVEHVFIAPGNAGTALEPKCSNIAIPVNDFDAHIEFCHRERIDLTIVGPEDPLVNGIREHFDAAGLKCFAPSREAAQLEGSKGFAKAFMQRHDIPTAAYLTTGRLDEAIAYIEAHGSPIVVKANGLAAGKGVVVAQSISEAVEAATEMLSGDRFGDAGREIVIEEFLEGEEASYIVMSDGTSVLPFASSQDHKPVFDGGLGPNTGGMGAYSPAPVVDDLVEAKILDRVIRPLIAGMAAEGTPFQGFLYAGLMISKNQDVHVVEFNCRFGDPEAQPVLYRLQSSLPSLCLAAVDSQLSTKTIEFDDRAAVGVVVASGGYPESYETGYTISGLDQIPAGAKAFHAGTRVQNDEIETSGGRVLCVVGADADFMEARQLAYSGIDAIHFKDQHYRTDIGYRVIERLQH
ncbi:MAG: phosphoribosylamine--glycine ligase [Gammaproteobacteria bacterium]|nr:phosphoribosylamine--glycine ligase [Gammaproteobacteria bacterium]